MTQNLVKDLYMLSQWIIVTYFVFDCAHFIISGTIQFFIYCTVIMTWASSLVILRL